MIGRHVYAVFLGLVLALFAAWAMAAWFPMPQRYESQAQLEAQTTTVALISLVIAVLVMGIGIGLSGNVPVISEGLLLGGLFTLIYSIGWCFIWAPKIGVLHVAVGLVIMIVGGYRYSDHRQSRSPE